MNEQKHPDGIWHTTEHLYRDRKIMIKAKRFHGMKAHVFKPGSDKVDFTLRYNWVNPEKLLQKCINKIEKKYPNDLLLSSEQNPDECDATEDAQGTEAGKQINNNHE